MSEKKWLPLNGADPVAKVAPDRLKSLPWRNRVRILDTLRGFSVISMVLYHATYDLVYLFGVQAAWYVGWPGYLWQQSICWVFILVSGATQHYGGHPVRRGLTVLAAGCIITLATALFMPGQVIWFGILHFMGCAMLLSAALRPLLLKIPAAWGAVVSFLLFLLLKGVPRGHLGLEWVPLVALPESLYSLPGLFALGFPSAGFFSADYFPLIPWLFLFLAGWFGWKQWGHRAKKSSAMPGPLGLVGRHALGVYVLHQPLVYGILLLVQKIGWL